MLSKRFVVDLLIVFNNKFFYQKKDDLILNLFFDLVQPVRQARFSTPAQSKGQARFSTPAQRSKLEFRRNSAQQSKPP